MNKSHVYLYVLLEMEEKVAGLPLKCVELFREATHLMFFPMEAGVDNIF